MYISWANNIMKIYDRMVKTNNSRWSFISNLTEEKWNGFKYSTWRQIPRFFLKDFFNVTFYLNWQDISYIVNRYLYIQKLNFPMKELREMKLRRRGRQNTIYSLYFKIKIIFYLHIELWAQNTLQKQFSFINLLVCRKKKPFYNK